MPRVYNKNTIFPGENENELVFVGRPTKWGNPFMIGKDGTREQVIKRYRQVLERSPDVQAEVRAELKGKDLLCFCFPLACHADVLLEFANREEKDDV